MKQLSSTRALSSLLMLLVLIPDALAAEKAPPVPQTLDGVAFLTTPGARWKLRWHDEFDGDTLDAAKWTFGLPWGGTDGTGRHHNPLYASYMMEHNVVVADGRLRLLTRREDVKDAKGRDFRFTQGMVTTAKHFRHTFGYWEARAKLPAEAGPGLWPAFWTLAEGWPPEMDICEVWTSNNRSHQGLCYRRPGGGKEVWDDVDTRAPLPTGWTTYGMEWGPGYQVYNVAGTVTKRVYGDHVTEDAHYILLNSGVDAQKPPTAATVFPNAFEVDYVRVYARPEGPIVHAGGFEGADVRPWETSGYAAAVAYGARRGTRALRLDGSRGAAQQKVYGLTPQTTYVLSAWVNPLTTDGAVRLGVTGHGAGAASAPATRPATAPAPAAASEYRQVTLEFTTGPKATTATITCAVEQAAGAALLDDVTIATKRSN